jgi:hypothetical protein
MKIFTLTVNTIEALTRYCLPVAEAALTANPELKWLHGVQIHVTRSDNGLGANLSGYTTDQCRGVYFEGYPGNSWESSEDEGESFSVFLSVAALKAIKAAKSPYAVYGVIDQTSFYLIDASKNNFFTSAKSETDIDSQAIDLRKPLKQEYKEELTLGYAPDKTYQSGRKGEKTVLKMSVLSMMQERLKELSQVADSIVTLTITPCKPIELFCKNGNFTYAASSEYEPQEAPHGLQPIRFNAEYLAWCLRGKQTVSIQTNYEHDKPWLFQHKVNSYGTDLVNIMLMPCAKG